MMTFKQHAELQQQMNIRFSAGPSGNVNPFDNIPMGMRSELGRGTPETVFAKAVANHPGLKTHTREVHVNSDNGQVVTFDYIFAVPPRR